MFIRKHTNISDFRYVCGHDFDAFSIKRPTVFAHRPVRTVKKLISLLVLVLVFTFASLQKSS